MVTLRYASQYILLDRNKSNIHIGRFEDGPITQSLLVSQKLICNGRGVRATRDALGENASASHPKNERTISRIFAVADYGNEIMRVESG